MNSCPIWMLRRQCWTRPASLHRTTHSRSVLPLCQSGENAGWADDLICEHNGHGGHVFPQRMVLHDRYKYVFSLHDMDELYDLQDDPFELNNLVHSAEHVDLIEELRARLIRHFGASTERDMRLKRFFLLALENNL